MAKLHILAGTPIPVRSMGTTIAQPKIREIAAIGEDKYFTVLSLFQKADKEDFKSEILKAEEARFKKENPDLEMTEDDKREIEFELDITYPSDFSVFAYLLKTFPDLRSSFESFLYIIFPNLRKVSWAPTLRLTFVGEEPIDFTEDMFIEIKDIALSSLNYRTAEEKRTEFNPANNMASEIAEKIKRAKEKRNTETSSNSTESPLADMSSILASTSNLSIQEVMDMTYPQLVIQYERSSLLLGFVNQIRASAFGGLDPDDIIDWTKTL